MSATDRHARSGPAKCDHCRSVATHSGHAFPAGGSFPVTGCRPCLDALAEDVAVNVSPIAPAGASDMRPRLVAYLTGTGWVAPTQSGPSGGLWRYKNFPYAVPMPELLDDEGPDWELVLNRLAFVEQSTPLEVERRIRSTEPLAEERSS